MADKLTLISLMVLSVIINVKQDLFQGEAHRHSLSVDLMRRGLKESGVEANLYVSVSLEIISSGLS